MNPSGTVIDLMKFGNGAQVFHTDTDNEKLLRSDISEPVRGRHSTIHAEVASFNYLCRRSQARFAIDSLDLLPASLLRFHQVVS
jgi:hypothetical protein